MSRRQQPRNHQTHSVEVRQEYERVLAGAPVQRRYLDVGAQGRAIDRPGQGLSDPSTCPESTTERL